VFKVGDLEAALAAAEAAGTSNAAWFVKFYGKQDEHSGRHNTESEGEGNERPN
jgi:hypothetical protein